MMINESISIFSLLSNFFLYTKLEQIFLIILVITKNSHHERYSTLRKNILLNQRK